MMLVHRKKTRIFRGELFDKSESFGFLGVLLQVRHMPLKVMKQEKKIFLDFVLIKLCVFFSEKSNGMIGPWTPSTLRKFTLSIFYSFCSSL